MHQQLKQQVRIANQKLTDSLVDPNTTFGNLSAIDETHRFVAIKPSGIPFNELQDNDIPILDLNGNIIEGDKKPSSDTPTHLELYKAFPQIKSIIHTHSQTATAFAQAKTPIKCIGTTHADYFNGTIPVTRDLTPEEINNSYELNIGRVIVETFNQHQPNPINPLEISACLVSSHGSFVWGDSITQTLSNAHILEQIAKLNFQTLLINPNTEINKNLLTKHYQRKHGRDAYYGQ